MDYWSFSCDEMVQRSTYNEMKTIDITEEHLANERKKNRILIMKNQSLHNANQQFISSYKSLKLQMNELLQERTALFQKNVSIIYQLNKYKKELQAYKEIMYKTTKRNKLLLDELIRNNNLVEEFLTTSSHENDQCLYDFDYTSENCNQIKIENKECEQDSSYRGRLRPGDPLLTPVQEEENYVSNGQETFEIDSLEKRLNLQIQNNNVEGRVLPSPQGDSKFKVNKNHSQSAAEEEDNLNKIVNDHEKSATNASPVQKPLSNESSENLVTFKNVRDFFPPVDAHQKIDSYGQTSQRFQSVGTKNFEIHSEEAPLINCQLDNGRQEISDVLPKHLDKTIRDNNNVITEKDNQKYSGRNVNKKAKTHLSSKFVNKRGRKICIRNDDEVDKVSIKLNIIQDRDERIKSSSRNDIKYSKNECVVRRGNKETSEPKNQDISKVNSTPKCKKKEKTKSTMVYRIQTRSKAKKDKQSNVVNASNKDDANAINDNASKTYIIADIAIPCENIAIPCMTDTKENQTNGSEQQGLKTQKKRARTKPDSDSLTKNKYPKQSDNNLPISTPKSNISSLDSIDFEEISLSPINKLKISDKNNTIFQINNELNEPNDILPSK